MNKLYFCGAAAIGMLVLASCSQEEIVGGGNGGATVFQIQLPDNLATRASFGEGATATNLYVAIYKAGETTPLLTNVNGEVDGLTVNNFAGSLTTTVSAQLVKNESYDLVFWAESGDANGSAGYTFDVNTQSINVDYEGMENFGESRDAFCKTVKGFVSKGEINQTVVLTRPFAQINIGTNDLPAYLVAAGNLSTQTFGMTVSGVANTLNLSGATPVASTSAGFNGEVTVTSTVLPSDNITEDFPVSGYSYLDMGYFLVGDENSAKTNLNVTLTVGDADFQTYASVPAQMNYRTNIYGSLLTNKEKFNVEIDPIFNNPDYDLDVVEVASNNPEDVLAAAANGGRVVVSGNMEQLDITSLNPAAPLSLAVTGNVGELVLGTKEADQQSITISIPKDVKFPDLTVAKGNNLVNLTIEGDPTSTQPCTSGINAYDQNVTTINNVTISNVHFDTKGVNFAFTANPSQLSNVTIENCVFTNLTEPFFQSSNNEYAGTVQENIVLRGNTVTFADNAATNSNGTYLANMTGNITIENNVITNAPYHGITVSPSLKIMNAEKSAASKVTVTGNTIVTPKQDGIKFDQTFGNVNISSNKITPLHYGIRLARFSNDWIPNVTITDNSIDMSASKNFYHGIYFQNFSPYNGTAVVKVFGNIKAGGSPTNWFGTAGFTASEGSDIENPFNS